MCGRPSLSRSCKQHLPKAFHELERIRQTLEKHFKDVQDFEFTIEDGVVYMLQTRNGKRTAMAALKFSIDMEKEKLIDWKTAVMRNPADQLDQLLAPVFDTTEAAKATVIATGLPAGPGRRVRADLLQRRSRGGRGRAKGEQVLLVRVETSPEDLRGMIAAEGILTARGGVSSHAALVARQMGKVCVCGAAALEVDYQARTVKVDGRTFKEGDWLSIDGTAGKVFAGRVDDRAFGNRRRARGRNEAARKTEKFKSFQQLMKWCDKATRMVVRTNADTPEQTENALAFGAVGIGLCRTEHMFFEGDRIDAMREMILAETLEARKAALAKLLPYQRDDFAGIFRALKGYPATIRFLDPPLHEFLPQTPEQQKALAKKLGVASEKIHLRVEQLHEFNPMLGLRGCRLGIDFPEISEMQARAVFEAAAIVQKEGTKVRPEVMIPLVGFKKEFDLQLEIVHRVAKEVQAERKVKLELPGGHDDRNPARRADRRRDRADGRVLQLRHQRSHADGTRDVARRLGVVPAALRRARDREEQPVCDHRSERRRPAGRDRGGQGACDASEDQARYLRRARRRPGVDSLFREGRARLRQRVAVPCARRPSGGGPGGDCGEEVASGFSRTSA